MSTPPPIPGLGRLDVPAGDRDLLAWVRRVARLASPERVEWCETTSDRENLVATLVASGALVSLSATTVVPAALPVLAPERVLTATRRRVAGPGRGSLVDPDALHEQVVLSFEDCMRGRVLYVVPVGSGGHSSDGQVLQLTDSPFVAAVLLGDAVPFKTLRATDSPLRAVHSVGVPLVLRKGERRADVPWPSNDRAWLARLPQERETWSFGTAHEPRITAVSGAPLELAAVPRDAVA